MNQAALNEAIRLIDEAAAGPCSPDQARRLAVLRAQLWLLAWEAEKNMTLTSTECTDILLRAAAE